MYSKEFSFECIRSQRATNGRKLGRVEHSPVLDVRKEEKKKKKKKETEKSFEGINFPVGRARNVSGEEE